MRQRCWEQGLMCHDLQQNELSSDEGESHLMLSCLSPDNSSVKKRTKKT